ncbi:hypothetical protein BGX24_012434 [Mortierella sp. AD032]|nr:hypothetical protein BGX24_012434 [Mortierella sp. AD032]
MENLEPRDTDMSSPPSNFHSLPSSQSTATTASTQATESQQQQQQQQQAKSQQRPKGTKKSVNDGYIYHPYEEYSQTGKDSYGKGGRDSSDNSAADGQASATRILELRGLERRIIQLLETAGQAIQILAGEDDPENAGPILMDNSSSTENAQEMIIAHADQKSQQFQVLAAGYATLVNEIQSGLRRQFHYLTKAGISSTQVPFKNVVYGEEKELETWLNAVDVLEESANGLIEKVEREYLGVRDSSSSSGVKKEEGDESLPQSSALPAATSFANA